MDFLEHVMLGFRQHLDPRRYFVQLLQHGVLSSGEAMHPPEADPPTSGANPGENKGNRLHIETRIHSASVRPDLKCRVIRLISRELIASLWAKAKFHDLPDRSHHQSGRDVSDLFDDGVRARSAALEPPRHNPCPRDNSHRRNLLDCTNHSRLHPGPKKRRRGILITLAWQLAGFWIQRRDPLPDSEGNSASIGGFRPVGWMRPVWDLPARPLTAGRTGAGGNRFPDIDGDDRTLLDGGYHAWRLQPICSTVDRVDRAAVID
jgi:hypothetical protein